MYLNNKGGSNELLYLGFNQDQGESGNDTGPHGPHSMQATRTMFCPDTEASQARREGYRGGHERHQGLVKTTRRRACLTLLELGSHERYCISFKSECNHKI